ncbi:MAG: hypothetical protein WB778_06610 [Thermoplasmata archaeon]
MREPRSRARLVTTFAIGIVVGVVIFAAAVVGLGYTFKSSTAGQVTIGSIWVNYTYTTPTPMGDSQPLNEMFQNFVPGQASAEGSSGSQLGFTLSPYDNSTVNCTLWSLTVFSPFKLMSITVTALPSANETVNEPLPVLLPAAIHGTSRSANLAVVIGLPDSSGTYALVISGTAACD